MAFSLSTKILLTIGAVTTTGFFVRRADERKRKRQKRKPPTPTPTPEPTPEEPTKSRDESCLANLYVPGLTLAETGKILNGLDPSLPIDEISVTEVNLDVPYQEAGYEYMLHLVANLGYDLTGPDTRDDAIQRVLRVMAPGCDWDQGLAPYTYDSPFRLVWEGVGTLGDLAQSNYLAKTQEA